MCSQGAQTLRRLPIFVLFVNSPLIWRTPMRFNTCLCHSVERQIMPIDRSHSNNCYFPLKNRSAMLSINLIEKKYCFEFLLGKTIFSWYREIPFEYSTNRHEFTVLYLNPYDGIQSGVAVDDVVLLKNRKFHLICCQ